MQILESIGVTYVYVSFNYRDLILPIIACMHLLQIIDSQGVFECINKIFDALLHLTLNIKGMCNIVIGLER